MKFRNLDNGTIYDVIDEEQIPFYEINPHFEAVVEKPKAVEKKTTKK